jgi:hypothetical protein
MEAVTETLNGRTALVGEEEGGRSFSLFETLFRAARLTSRRQARPARRKFLVNRIEESDSLRFRKHRSALSETGGLGLADRCRNPAATSKWQRHQAFAQWLLMALVH